MIFCLSLGYVSSCALSARVSLLGSKCCAELFVCRPSLQSCISKLRWLLERIARLPVACSRTLLNIVRFSVSQKVAHLLCVLEPAQTCTTQVDVLLVDAFERRNDLSHSTPPTAKLFSSPSRVEAAASTHSLRPVTSPTLAVGAKLSYSSSSSHTHNTQHTHHTHTHTHTHHTHTHSRVLLHCGVAARNHGFTCAHCRAETGAFTGASASWSNSGIVGSHQRARCCARAGLQEHTSKRIVEQAVDVPVPQPTEVIVENDVAPAPAHAHTAPAPVTNRAPALVIEYVASLVSPRHGACSSI